MITRRSALAALATFALAPSSLVLAQDAPSLDPVPASGAFKITARSNQAVVGRVLAATSPELANLADPRSPSPLDPVVTQEANGTRVTTPFYSVLLPEGADWTYFSDVHPWSGDVGCYRGHVLSLTGTDISVYVTSGDWDGVQGEFRACSAGPLAFDPMWQVVVSFSANYSSGSYEYLLPQVLEFASRVSTNVVVLPGEAEGPQVVTVALPTPLVVYHEDGAQIVTPHYTVDVPRDLWPQGAAYTWSTCLNRLYEGAPAGQSAGATVGDYLTLFEPGSHAPRLQVMRATGDVERVVDERSVLGAVANLGQAHGDCSVLARVPANTQPWPQDALPAAQEALELYIPCIEAPAEDSALDGLVVTQTKAGALFSTTHYVVLAPDGLLPEGWTYDYADGVLTDFSGKGEGPFVGYLLTFYGADGQAAMSVHACKDVEPVGATGLQGDGFVARVVGDSRAKGGWQVAMASYFGANPSTQEDRDTLRAQAERALDDYAALIVEG